MRYAEIQDRSDADFKRLTGVTHNTFKKMLAVMEREMPPLGVLPN